MIGDMRRRALLSAAVGTAALGLLLIVALLVPSTRPTAMGGYLFAYLAFAMLAIGSLGMTMLQHLVRAKWGLAVLRIFEAAGGAGTFLVLLIGFVPVYLGRGLIFPWMKHTPRAGDWYLNSGFFALRGAVYFLLWIGLAALLRRSSTRVRQTSADAQFRTNISGPGLCLLFGTGSLAGYDWLMSLDRDWSSTIFGMLFMVTCGFAAMGWASAFFARFAKEEPFRQVSDPGLLRDFANLLLTMLLLWAYLTFSQYIISWSGNLQEEARYYAARTGPVWDGLSAFLIAFGFFGTFLALQVPPLKSRPRPMRWLGLWILAINLIWLYWMAVARLHPGGSAMPTWQDVVAFVGVGGCWLAAFWRQFAASEPLPPHDPTLRRLLDHAVA